MKSFRRFLVQYKLFSLAVIALLVSLLFRAFSKHSLADGILGTVAILEVLPLLRGMWHDVRAGKYGIDILAATAIVASVLLGQYWAAIVVVIMLTGGESLEDFAEHRARSELDALLKHAPQKAHVIRSHKTIDVKVSELRVGDRLLIKAGELVPVDAVILEGTASFDEASLTGESLPQVKQVNEQLLSGSINLDGAITAKALATAEDSQYQQIIKLVRGAAASQAPFVRLADRYSMPFTLMAYAIAGAVWVISGQSIRFLEVIIVATPCPLLLAAPIALISGMSRASHYGIIVKTGAALEKLAEVQTFAFDKTGTLTRGQLIVHDVRHFGTQTNNEILSLAAGLEQSSNHVLSRTITDYAKDQKVKLAKAKHVREIAGQGLSGSVKGQTVLVGGLSLLAEYEVSLPKNLKVSDIKQTAVYVAVDHELAGVILLSDEIRDEAKATLKALHQLGAKDILMITGDNQASADYTAKQLDINHVYAETLPADKLRILEGVKTRPLVYVGDGVNDAPALTASDVGIALGARGSTAASESADMVIMLDDLGKVAEALKIAKRTFSIATQSIFIGIGLSLILMLIFATGRFQPLLGAVLQEVVDVVVIFNALRAHLS